MQRAGTLGRALAHPAPERGPVSPQLVAGASVTVLGCLVCGALGAATGLVPLQLALLGVCFFGIGSAVVRPARTRVSTAAYVALSVLLSLCVLVGVGLAMAESGHWWPAPVFAVVGVGVGAVHLRELVLARAMLHATPGPEPEEEDAEPAPPVELPVLAGASSGRPRPPYGHAGWPAEPGPLLDVPPPPPLPEPVPQPAPILGRRPTATVVLLAVGTPLWLGAALLQPAADPDIGGLLVAMPVWWYAGLALTLMGVLTARRDREDEAAVAVLLLALALTVTPALVYGTPKIQSAAKHVGIVDSIRAGQHLHPQVIIYDAWPGFFAAMAWVCDVAGIKDTMRLAAFWPAFTAVFRVAMIRFLCGRALGPGYRCWVAATFAVLVDVVGQDYFAPQAVAFILGLGAYALAIPGRDETRERRARRLVLLALLGATISVTHQLSPYIVFGSLCVLVVFRVVRPWWTPALVLGPAATWALVNLHWIKDFIGLNGMGDASNFRPPTTVAAPGLSRLPIVGLTVGALLLGIAVVGVGAVLALISNRRVARAWAMAWAAGSGLAVVIVNAYGNEGTFRAMLFGLPWIALLASAYFVPQRGREHPRLLAVAASVLLGTFLVGTFGLDASNVIRRGDLAAYRYFEYHAPAGSSSLALGDGDLPARPTRRNLLMTNQSRKSIELPIGARSFSSPAQEVAAVTRAFIEHSYGTPLQQLYAVWSPASSAYDWEYALQRPEDFARIRDAMLAAPYWSVVFRQDGTYLFRLSSAPPPAAGTS